MGVEVWWSLLAIVLAACLWSLWKQQSETVGPKCWPVVGCLFDVVLNKHRMHDWIYGELCKSPTATMSMTVLGRRIIITANPQNVEYILRTNFENFPKGENFRQILGTLLGNGIFNSDGDIWKRHRKIASFEFSSKKLRVFSTQAFRVYALRLINILKNAADLPKAVDFQDLVLRMTLDSICKIGFGVDLGALSPSMPEIRFGKCFDRASEMTAARFFRGFLWKLKRILNIGSERILRKDVEELDVFTAGIINARRAELMSLKANGIQPENADLLSRFMLHADGDEPSYSDRDLRDAVLNFVIAGRDTSAATLTWFSYIICLHPGVSEKIFEEIKDTVGIIEGEGYSEFAEKLTYETLGEMQYLHAAVSEALRLYPPVPGDGKTAAADAVLPDGTKVPKGASVEYVPYAMGRMKSLWGPDAGEFKPERWLKDGQFQNESYFKFTAFQAGARICLGKDSAYLQIKMTLALMLRFLRLRMVADQSIRYRGGLVLQMANGIQVFPHFLS